MNKLFVNSLWVDNSFAWWNDLSRQKRLTIIAFVIYEYLENMLVS